jgi:hypothetical protein
MFRFINISTGTDDSNTNDDSAMTRVNMSTTTTPPLKCRDEYPTTTWGSRLVIFSPNDASTCPLVPHLPQNADKGLETFILSLVCFFKSFFYYTNTYLDLVLRCVPPPSSWHPIKTTMATTMTPNDDDGHHRDNK